jgi:hypothetical protein
VSATVSATATVIATVIVTVIVTGIVIVIPRTHLTLLAVVVIARAA